MSLIKVNKQRKDHMDYIYEVKQLINNKCFGELMNFTNFSLCELRSTGSLRKILKNNNIMVTKYVIDNMCSINSLSPNGWSLIHSLLYYSQDTSLIKYFVYKYHISLESATKDREKPIHFACQVATVETVKFLMDNGVDLESKTIEEVRPIHSACYSGKIEIVQFLVDRKVDLEATTINQLRPIHVVCQNANFDIVQLLTHEGVNLETATIEGRKPIHFACQYKSLEIMQFLISKGVNLETQCISTMRPIHYACRYGTLDIIQFLINKEVNLEATTEWGWRPIHVVCYYQTYEIIKYFLSKNIILNTKINRYDGAYAEYGVKDLLLMSEKLSLDHKEELLCIISERENE